MKKFDINAIRLAVLNALEAGDAFEKQLTTLQKLLKGADRAIVKDLIAPIVAGKYGEKFENNAWADSGCAAKRKANRIINAIVNGAGAAPKQADKTAVDKKLAKAVSSIIIEAGLNKKQFYALIAAIKAGIQFTK